ncbi:MAG: FAD binding domain-containing protein [Nitrososphaerota archaeon]
MIRLPKFEYRAARSIDEALTWLGEASGAAAGNGEKDPEARVMLMAGGTDVLPNMKHRLFTPQVVVGLRGVRALRGITDDPNQGTRIGAGVSLAEIAASPAIRGRIPALAQAAESVSTPQLRHMGTLGGNLCLDTRCNYYNQSEAWRKALDFCLKKGSDICRVAPNGQGCYAVSSCDTAPVLIALDATARIAARDGERTVPVHALYHDDGIHPVRLRTDEVLREVYIPTLADGWRSTYLKYRVRGSFDFPIIAVAAAAHFDGAICTQARVVLQGVATHPVSLPTVNDLLRGQRWTPDLLEAAAEEAYRAAHPMDNTSGTIALRRRMVRAYTRRALESLLAA